MLKSIRSFARALALRFPPFRRLHDLAVSQQGQIAQLAQTIERLRASNAEIGEQLIERATAAESLRVELEAGGPVPHGLEAAFRAERDRAWEAVATARAKAADAIASRIVAEETAQAAMRAQTDTLGVLAELRAEVQALWQQHWTLAAERDLALDRLGTQDKKLEQYAMAEARIAMLASDLRSGGDRRELDTIQAEMSQSRDEKETVRISANALEANLAELEQATTRRSRAGDEVKQLNISLQAAGQRIAQLEDAVGAAYNQVADAQQERDAARAKSDQANHDLRIANAENMARLLGKLSFVEYAMQGASPSSRSGDGAASRRLYLDLLEGSLLGFVDNDTSISPWTESKFNPELRLLGRDWPEHALTMIGAVRMRNLRILVERLLREQVPGDLIETGVWRGGACIYMRGILAAYGDLDRKVWVADSFEGLPAPSTGLYPEDAGDAHSTYEALAVPLDDVRNNFRRYGLLDEGVKFLPGWFRDTLPDAPINRLALLRLDGDMYESTLQALNALYTKVAPGGFVIVDDFGLAGCRQAIEDFRGAHEIVDPIEDIDGASVFWRKTSAALKADVVVMSDKRRLDQTRGAE